MLKLLNVQAPILSQEADLCSRTAYVVDTSYLAGFVNPTAMGKADSKKWSKYRESNRYQTCLDAMAETFEIRMVDQIEPAKPR